MYFHYFIVFACYFYLLSILFLLYVLFYLYCFILKSDAYVILHHLKECIQKSHIPAWMAGPLRTASSV